MPLCACLRDESGFHWSDEAQQSLAHVKKLLAHSPALFDPGLPVVNVEKEALACVLAVERWKTNLWGHRFTLLMTKGTDRAGMRIARWAAQLLCFNYMVEYRAGSENQTADCLSRLSLPLTSDSE